MQFTSAFQYAGNQIATSFNIRNIFLHARDTWATLSNFPLTTVQRIVHRSVTILKEPRLTTKCLNTTGINYHLKCQYISEKQYLHQLVLKYWRHTKKYSPRTRAIYHFCYPFLVVCHFETNFLGCCDNSFPSEVVKCKNDLPLTNPICNFDKKISFVRSIMIYFSSTVNSLRERDTTIYIARLLEMS